ncbi:hypothetical protein HK405_007602, partial [Cladochytrium tenue]
MASAPAAAAVASPTQQQQVSSAASLWAAPPSVPLGSLELLGSDGGNGGGGGDGAASPPSSSPAKVAATNTTSIAQSSSPPPTRQSRPPPGPTLQAQLQQLQRPPLAPQPSSDRRPSPPTPYGEGAAATEQPGSSQNGNGPMIAPVGSRSGNGADNPGETGRPLTPPLPRTSAGRPPAGRQVGSGGSSAAVAASVPRRRRTDGGHGTRGGPGSGSSTRGGDFKRAASPTSSSSSAATAPGRLPPLLSRPPPATPPPPPLSATSAPSRSMSTRGGGGGNGGGRGRRSMPSRRQTIELEGRASTLSAAEDISLATKPSGQQRFALELASDPALLKEIMNGRVGARPPEYRRRLLLPEAEQELTFEIMDLIQSTLTPSREAVSRQRKFVAKIAYLLTKQWPDSGIVVHQFGSSVNGLGTPSSDVDLCVTTSWSHSDGINDIHLLAAFLRSCGMTKVYTVGKAKVPICKFYDPELRITCDINVNNTIALHNTRLIKAYLEVDPRALNFLQTRSHPIIPSLQKLYFDRLEAAPAGNLTVRPVLVDGVDCSFHDDVASLRGFGSANHETLGALVYAFFRWYAYEFDYGEQVASVRQGCLVNKRDKGWDVDVDRMWRRLCVEEPFTPHRNLANSADAVSVAGLALEFRRAVAVLERTASIDALCEPYFAAVPSPAASVGGATAFPFGRVANPAPRNNAMATASPPLPLPPAAGTPESLDDGGGGGGGSPPTQWEVLAATSMEAYRTSRAYSYSPSTTSSSRATPAPATGGAWSASALASGTSKSPAESISGGGGGGGGAGSPTYSAGASSASTAVAPGFAGAPTSLTPPAHAGYAPAVAYLFQAELAAAAAAAAAKGAGSLDYAAVPQYAGWPSLNQAQVVGSAPPPALPLTLPMAPTQLVLPPHSSAVPTAQPAAASPWGSASSDSPARSTTSSTTASDSAWPYNQPWHGSAAAATTTGLAPRPPRLTLGVQPPPPLPAALQPAATAADLDDVVSPLGSPTLATTAAASAAAAKPTTTLQFETFAAFAAYAAGDPTAPHRVAPLPHAGASTGWVAAATGSSGGAWGGGGGPAPPNRELPPRWSSAPWEVAATSAMAAVSAGRRGSEPDDG